MWKKYQLLKESEKQKRFTILGVNSHQKEVKY